MTVDISTTAAPAPAIAPAGAPGLANTTATDASPRAPRTAFAMVLAQSDAPPGPTSGRASPVRGKSLPAKEGDTKDKRDDGDRGDATAPTSAPLSEIAAVDPMAGALGTAIPAALESAMTVPSGLAGKATQPALQHPGDVRPHDPAFPIVHTQSAQGLPARTAPGPGIMQSQSTRSPTMSTGLAQQITPSRSETDGSVSKPDRSQTMTPAPRVAAAVAPPSPVAGRDALAPLRAPVPNGIFAASPITLVPGAAPPQSITPLPRVLAGATVTKAPIEPLPLRKADGGPPLGEASPAQPAALAVTADDASVRPLGTRQTIATASVSVESQPLPAPLAASPSPVPAAANQASSQPQAQVQRQAAQQANAQSASSAPGIGAVSTHAAPTRSGGTAAVRSGSQAPHAATSEASATSSKLAGDLQPMLTLREPEAQLSIHAQASDASQSQPGPADFGALVERLIAAREASGSARVDASIAHTDFGRIELNFAPDGGGMTVSMHARDPDFVPSVQSAVSMMPIPAPAPADSFSAQSEANHMAQTGADSGGQGSSPEQPRHAANAPETTPLHPRGSVNRTARSERPGGIYA